MLSVQKRSERDPNFLKLPPSFGPPKNEMKPGRRPYPVPPGAKGLSKISAGKLKLPNSSTFPIPCGFPTFQWTQQPYVSGEMVSSEIFPGAERPSKITAEKLKLPNSFPIPCGVPPLQWTQQPYVLGEMVSSEIFPGAERPSKITAGKLKLPNSFPIPCSVPPFQWTQQPYLPFVEEAETEVMRRSDARSSRYQKEP